MYYENYEWLILLKFFSEDVRVLIQRQVVNQLIVNTQINIIVSSKNSSNFYFYNIINSMKLLSKSIFYKIIFLVLKIKIKLIRINEIIIRYFQIIL
jgi:hypothetical protein